MPSLIDLRRRIRAVKSTQQITKAMKMIAASRLRRAQDRIIAARPFADRMQAVLAGLGDRVDADAHPLLRVPERDTRPLLVVITGDRGLCGSFNSNVIKTAGQFIIDRGPAEVPLGLVGRKGREFFGRRGFEVVCELTGVFQRLHFDHAAAVADAVMEAFTSGNVTSVHLVYNEFRSVMSQQVVSVPLLPFVRPEAAAAAPAGPRADYLYEPDAAAIFASLLPRHVQTQVFRAMLESNAAFFAAQMTAMDAATRNASEMIEDLTLYMNKVRQAAITREIIEVVSGASAT